MSHSAEGPRGAGRRRTARPGAAAPRVIEGEVRRIESRALPAPVSRPSVAASPAPPPLGAPPSFGRRLSRPGDFVFPPRDETIRRVPRERGPFARRATMVGGFVLGLLAAPALLLTLSEAPVAATISAEGPNGLSVEGVVADIAPRGAGEVLHVSGEIPNAATADSPSPILRIVLRMPDGRVLARPFQPTAARVPAGGSLSFETAIAVPAGSGGDLSVSFLPRGAAS